MTTGSFFLLLLPLALLAFLRLSGNADDDAINFFRCAIDGDSVFAPSFLTLLPTVEVVVVVLMRLFKVELFVPGATR